MQGVNEIKLKRDIAVRNDPTYIKTKVSIKFLLLFVCGILVGGAVFNSEYVDTSTLDIMQIKTHFDSIFVDCETFFDHLLTVLMCSENNLRCLALIVISGFTYFCFIASGAVIFGKGFLFGFTTSALTLLERRYPNAVTKRYVLGFMIFNAIAAFILIFISVSAYIFSFDYRAAKRNRLVLRRDEVMYEYAFALVLALGGLLISGYLYCVFFAFN